MKKENSSLICFVLLIVLLCCHCNHAFVVPVTTRATTTTTTKVLLRTGAGKGAAGTSNLPWNYAAEKSIMGSHKGGRRNLRRNVKAAQTSTCLSALPLLSGGAASAAATAGMSSSSLLPILRNVQQSLHSDPSFVLTSMLLLSIFGVALERRTMLGKALSAPLATMALALIVANLGLVPFSSPALYTTLVNSYLVPLAVPMLLFDSDLKRVWTDTGSMLMAFFVGAISTVVGTLVAYPLLPLKALGADQGWRVACALAARHIGGAINFVAVADTLQIGGTAVSSAIAADNVVVALYFGLLFYLAKAGEGSSSTTASRSTTARTTSDVPTDAVAGVTNEETDDMVADPEDVTNKANNNGINLSTLGMCLSVSSVLVTVGRILTKALLPTGTSSLPLTSVLTVAAATAFPSFFRSIRNAGNAVGILFIQLFFAASGAGGNLGLVLRSAPSLFAFSSLQIGIHFGTLILVGKYLCRLPVRELYLASNANVGGPTTAAAMAQAKEWNSLVLPALLVGILGYATATAIALALGPILLRLPIIGT